jgi:NitT/TauT family transport system substrate-binding protein
MAKAKMTPLTKIILLALIGVTVFYGIKYLNNSGLLDKIAPKKGGSSSGFKLSKAENKEVIKVGVVTWGGYAGGQYFNKGFLPTKESRYFKDYGIMVEFKVIDDFNASRAAWKADEVDLMWITADAFPTEVNALKEFEPKILFQSDWSRGGDAIVVRRGIETAGDLKGKKIAVAYGTPSHTFLLWLLNAGNMSGKDVELVEVPSAIDAATIFKAGKVDAAVVWSPDDQDCVVKVAGSKVLKSTREATHIIADVFYAKAAYIQKNEENLKKLVEGWMRGAAEINTSEEAKAEAAKILSVGLNQDESFCLSAINNVRLCTFGDNKNFFGIGDCQACVTGEQLYITMAESYKEVGLIKESVPAWRTITYTNIIRSLSLSGAEHDAETARSFVKATPEEAKAEAFASKPVKIAFASGVAEVDENAKYIIDREFVNLAKGFSNIRIRVEGNTDNVGSPAANKILSYKRAQSVVTYLVNTYKFDPNRFVIIGNGPDKPVADNKTVEGRAQNRRTEFQLLN